MLFRFFIFAVILFSCPVASQAMQANNLSPTSAAPATPQKDFEPDFSKMPIEDALMAMFNLISDDARKDAKDQLDEMEQIRKQKQALRDAEEKLKAEKGQLRDARLVRLKQDKDALEAKQRNIFEKLKRIHDREKRLKPKRDSHFKPKHDEDDRHMPKHHPEDEDSAKGLGRLKPKHENEDRLKPKHDEDDRLKPKHESHFKPKHDSRFKPKHDTDEDANRLKPKHPDDSQSRLKPRHTDTPVIRPCPPSEPNCLQPKLQTSPVIH